MAELWQGPLEKIDEYRWRIPKSYKRGMRVDGIIYADVKLLKDIRHDKAAEQVANVAFLPGIVKCSIAMPDIHWGYGFPIGGVAATDIEKGGVVSPGGVGFDINCGVRLVRTNLKEADVGPKLKTLVAGLFSHVPAGVGSEGKIRATAKEEKEILLLCLCVFLLFFCAVLGTGSLSIGHAGRIQRPPDDVIPHTRKIFNPAAPD